MKTIQKFTFLFLLVTLIFAGCEKNEMPETKENSNLITPTEEEFQLATENLQKIDGWNSPEKPTADLKTLKVGEVVQISGYYSDGGTYVVSGNIYVSGCVPSNQKIHVVCWLYDFAIGQWKNASQKSGICMAEDYLDLFLTYYSNNAKTDFYVGVAVQIYIQNASGNVSLWNTFYSNVIFLNGPY